VWDLPLLDLLARASNMVVVLRSDFLRRAQDDLILRPFRYFGLFFKIVEKLVDFFGFYAYYKR